ncbi:MAG: ribonuclease P [Candidatus Aenigmarchaeota archaeon]|nr:ribonuclease P [Candidatus Aenigmarchaeota archaeon]
MRTPSKKPQWQKDIARERVEILFSLADRTFPARPDRAHRYVQLARKIAMRYTVRISPELRRRFCRACSHYLRPGVNVRFRTSAAQRAVLVTCLDCGHVSRLPYRRESGL